MSNRKDVRSDLDIAKRIVETHGNKLLGRVVKYFREKNWDTRISQYYVDEVTGKSREIDLIVEKRFVCTNTRNSEALVDVQLFIECKYIIAPVVFWFEKMDKRSAIQRIGRNTKFRIKPKGVVYDYVDSHHYLKHGGEVAKLFAAEGGKGDETEPMYRALSQCLSGYVKRRSHPIIERKSSQSPTGRLSYPVILCSSFDKFFRTTIDNSQQPMLLDRNFMFELHYAYPEDGGSEDEYMIVDVVELARLDEYLGVLETEVQALGNQLMDG